MQNTRLNILIRSANNRVTQWLLNPWRRISLLLLSLLFGNFLGTAISTVAGQSAVWDIALAANLTVLMEGCNWLVYNAAKKIQFGFWLDLLNCFKIGVVYSLFVEAFKLGS